jgi:hypothetical protein
MMRISDILRMLDQAERIIYCSNSVFDCKMKCRNYPLFPVMELCAQIRMTLFLRILHACD